METERPFTWRDPRFTYADILTGMRIFLLPFVIYGLMASLPGLTLVTLLMIVGTDLVDGRLARALGQQRPFGAMLDSTIDWVVIHSLFTVFFLIGVLVWWKFVPIVVVGILIGGTQLLSVIKTQALVFQRVLVGKFVGQLEFLYLLVLLARTFWLKTDAAQTFDHAWFALLSVGLVGTCIDHVGVLWRLYSTPRARA